MMKKRKGLEGLGLGFPEREAFPRFILRAEDRIIEGVGPIENAIKREGANYVADAGNLTTNEHLSFSIFQRGEIAALAGLDSRECPFHEERDIRWQEIWHRGFVYGAKEGED